MADSPAMFSPNVMRSAAVHATDVAAVTALLNEELLRACWGRLFLPAGVRRAWEHRFADLTSAA